MRYNIIKVFSFSIVFCHLVALTEDWWCIYRALISVHIGSEWLSLMAFLKSINMDSGNGFLFEGTQLLTEPIQSYHYYHPEEYIPRDFCRKVDTNHKHIFKK